MHGAFQILWFLPLLGGICLALMAAPLGCFMVWKRVSFFSDTLAHSILLGVSFHVLFHLPLIFSLLMTACIISFAFAWLYRRTHHPPDSFLVLLSQGGLALSLLLMHLADLASVELMTYLIGDILLLQANDVWVLASAAVIVIGVCFWLWSSLISVTAHADLAAIEGVPVGLMHMLLFGMMGLFTALSLPLAGALLLSAFLIAPPLTARRFARTPESMVLIAAGIGMGGVGLGIAGSFVFNLPTGPFIVLCLLACWGGSQFISPRLE